MCGCGEGRLCRRSFYGNDVGAQFGGVGTEVVQIEVDVVDIFADNTRRELIIVQLKCLAGVIL